MYKIREIKRDDLRSINLWRNSKELIDKLGAPFRYINLDTDEKWYENYLSNRNSTVRCSIVVETKDDQVLGLVSLTNINSVNQSATFHIMIGNKKQRGKGLGSFATREILNHAFNNLNLHRIELSVLEDNSRAIKLYERIGFIKEGVKRESVYKNGVFVNMIIMSILKKEYLEVKERDVNE